MTAASRGRLENGTSSVIHSSISIANEYASEYVVAGALLFSISSGAEYLTISPDDIVLDVAFSLTSSEIFAIPKSQICGSPLQVRSQRPSYESNECEHGTYFARHKHIFLRAFSQGAFTESTKNLTHLTA